MSINIIMFAVAAFFEIAGCFAYDGYMEDAQGDIEWMTSDTSFDDYSTALLQSIDGMIFGRKAHALLAEFWPTAGERPDATPALVAQARLMNALPKYVLTHGTERTGWAHSHAITVKDVPSLKARTTRRRAAAP